MVTGIMFIMLTILLIIRMTQQSKNIGDLFIRASWKNVFIKLWKIKIKPSDNNMETLIFEDEGKWYMVNIDKTSIPGLKEVYPDLKELKKL